MIKISRLSVMPIDKAMRKEENCHDKSSKNRKQMNHNETLKHF